MLKAGALAFITTPNIFSARSRLMFIQSGNLLWFNPNEVNKSGHIQILPPWLLEIAAARAGLHCLKKLGVTDVSNGFRWRGKIINIMAILLKKSFYKEKFPGEFSKMNLLMILRKQ